MEQDREKIEQTVRKCTDRLGFVTEESTRTGAINGQVQAIKEVQREKTQEQSIKKEGEAKGE